MSTTGRVLWVEGDYLAFKPDAAAAAEGCAPDMPVALFIPDANLSLVSRAEPPVGSVVVKDGVAWVKEAIAAPNVPDPWLSTVDEVWAVWADISDGTVIFRPGDEV